MSFTQRVSLYVKYLTEQSGFASSEGGIPIDKKGEYPALYAAFDGIEFVSDLPALPGEETLLGDLNSDSELRFNGVDDPPCFGIRHAHGVGRLIDRAVFLHAL